VHEEKGTDYILWREIKKKIDGVLFLGIIRIAKFKGWDFFAVSSPSSIPALFLCAFLMVKKNCTLLDIFAGKGEIAG